MKAEERNEEKKPSRFSSFFKRSTREGDKRGGFNPLKSMRKALGRYRPSPATPEPVMEVPVIEVEQLDELKKEVCVVEDMRKHRAKGPQNRKRKSMRPVSAVSSTATGGGGESGGCVDEALDGAAPAGGRVKEAFLAPPSEGPSKEASCGGSVNEASSGPTTQNNGLDTSTPRDTPNLASSVTSPPDPVTSPPGLVTSPPDLVTSPPEEEEEDDGDYVTIVEKVDDLAVDTAFSTSALGEAT